MVPNNLPSGNLDAQAQSFGSTVKKLSAEDAAVQQQSAEFKQRRAEMEPQLSQINQDATEGRTKLKLLIERSDIFKDVRFENLWSKDLWKAKVDAVQDRMALSREVDSMIATLKAQGVEKEHPTMVGLEELRAEATPNFVSRSALNAAEFTYKKPLMAAAGVFGLYWLNRLAAKATGDGFGGRLLRFFGIGFIAALAANHFNERERKVTAAKKAAIEGQPLVEPFPTSPSSEAYAHNVEGAYPDVAYSSWSPNAGSFNFSYPGPAYAAPSYPTYGPQMPFRPMPPQPVQGYYIRPDMYGNGAPPFMPQQQQYPQYPNTNIDI